MAINKGKIPPEGGLSQGLNLGGSLQDKPAPSSLFSMVGIPNDRDFGSYTNRLGFLIECLHNFSRFIGRGCL